MAPRKNINSSENKVCPSRIRLRSHNVTHDDNLNESPKIKKVKREITNEENFLSNLEAKVNSKGYINQEKTKDVMDQKPIAPIDKQCPIADGCFIFSDDEGIWDCMLNQTNIEFNNNKYYLIQLLKSNKKEEYFIWMRWGRIGFTGQHSLKEFRTNLQAAKNIFTKKFFDKTRNEWDERSSFEKIPGKYDLIFMDYQPGEDMLDSVKEMKKVESTLETQVKNLIELICDVKAMEQSLTDLLYDSKRAPLGKLTETQVVAGYSALRNISELIDSRQNNSRKRLLQACNIYYTRVPHAFKMKIPPLIETTAQIEVEMILLNTLADIQVAMDAIGTIPDSKINPTDEQYERLKCTIAHLGENDKEYKMLENYMKTTHGKTHSMYSLEVEHIFKIEKPEKKGKFKDVGNRMLLWHGSRQTNLAGILSQGLRIAPPEAPSTGYMFGKGIYFSDMASKSANYCNASPSKPRGILLLCEVALGKCNKLLQADYNANKLPTGCSSVHGCGKTAPDAKNLIKLDDGMLVPMGPTVAIDSQDSCLLYNEFIVYDPLQVKMKYLMQVKFDFSFNK